MPRKIHLIRIGKRDIERLESYLSENPKSYQDARDKLILCLFYFQGFRTSMIQSLKMNHYDAKSGVLTVPFSYKHEKALSILLDTVTTKHINFIASFNIIPDRPLLDSLANNHRIGIPITVRQIQRIVNKKMNKLGLPKNIPPRELKHLCAIRLTREKLTHDSLDKLVGRVSPWVFTAYKRRAKNFRQAGEI